MFFYQKNIYYLLKYLTTFNKQTVSTSLYKNMYDFQFKKIKFNLYFFRINQFLNII